MRQCALDFEFCSEKDHDIDYFCGLRYLRHIPVVVLETKP